MYPQNPPDWNPGKTVGKIVIILLKLLEFILYILRAWHHLLARNFRPAIYAVRAMYIMLAALKWVQVLICNLGSCVFLFMGYTLIIVQSLKWECDSDMFRKPHICLQEMSMHEILMATLRSFSTRGHVKPTRLIILPLHFSLDVLPMKIA